MYLRVSVRNTDKKESFMIESDGKKRPLDGFSRTASFDCGKNINCHANIEYIPKNSFMGFWGWLMFILKEIVTSILFFLVFDRGAWYENISPFRIKKKIAFKPSSNDAGELNFEFKNSVFSRKNGKYTLPKISIMTNGVILTEEVGYLPNLGGIRLGFIHYLFQVLVPSVILLAICAYGIIAGILHYNLPVMIIASSCAFVIALVDVLMLIRGVKTRRSIENIVLSQMRGMGI